jgi:hypothetical protein
VYTLYSQVLDVLVLRMIRIHAVPVSGEVPEFGDWTLDSHAHEVHFRDTDTASVHTSRDEYVYTNIPHGDNHRT